MPKISVIVPVLNASKYVDRCLESIVNQTISDIEILLMVGFGKDDSLVRCLSWQKNDDRIIVVCRKDTSLGDARNYALKVAKGDYIAYADADDYYSPNYLEKMCVPLERDQSIDISCCEYSKFDDSGMIAVSLYRKEEIVELDYYSYLVEVPEAAVWMKLFRRKWLLENRIEMFDGCCEDQALHFVLAALVKKAFLIKEPLYRYNIGNEGSLVRTFKSKTDFVPAAEYAISYLKDRNLFWINRNAILNRVVRYYKEHLQEINDDAELVLLYKNFLQKHFKEVLDYYMLQNSDRCIEKKIVLYGAGADGKAFLKRTSVSRIAYIVDKNSSLWGEYRSGLEIKPPNYLYREKEKISVIIASGKFFYEIVEDLLSRGIKNLFSSNEF